MRSSTTRVAKLLADLASALSEFGARWYVFGAQAAIVHGANRLTADVDVTLDIGLIRETLRRAEALLDQSDLSVAFEQLLLTSPHAVSARAPKRQAKRTPVAKKLARRQTTVLRKG